MPYVIRRREEMRPGDRWDNASMVEGSLRGDLEAGTRVLSWNEHAYEERDFYNYFLVWVDEAHPLATDSTTGIFSLSHRHKENHMLTAEISRKKDGFTYIYLKSPEVAELVTSLRTHRTGSNQTFNQNLAGEWSSRCEGSSAWANAIQLYRNNSEALAAVGLHDMDRPFTYSRGSGTVNIGSMLITNKHLAEGCYFRCSLPQSPESLQALGVGLRKSIQDLVAMSREITISVNLIAKPPVAAP